jgi:hypothetical protein
VTLLAEHGSLAGVEFGKERRNRKEAPDTRVRDYIASIVLPQATCTKFAASSKMRKAAPARTFIGRAIGTALKNEKMYFTKFPCDLVVFQDFAEAHTRRRTSCQ